MTVRMEVKGYALRLPLDLKRDHDRKGRQNHAPR